MPFKIRIEIVYAEPQHSIIKSFTLEAGALVRDALAKAATNPAFSNVDLLNSPVGIFGKVTRRDQLLNDGDRIEIYRPLQQEPKVARRSRASKPHAPLKPQ